MMLRKCNYCVTFWLYTALFDNDLDPEGVGRAEE